MLDYNIFFRFYDKFKAQGFLNIDPSDDLILEMEEKLQKAGQFFHIADLMQLKLLYVCKRCEDLFGVPKGEMNPSVYHSCTHPDDHNRFGMARGKVMKMASEMYHNKTENMFISSIFHTKIASGDYRNVLYQLCLFYTEVPYKTVFSIQVNTDISDLFMGKYENHFYVGTDKTIFRYPDTQLLAIGDILSNREIDIIKGISEGLDSQEIADKLFISVHTVNTHRRNILNKTGKRSTHELVIELQERGLL